MLSENEITRLKDFVEKRFTEESLDYKTFDTRSFIDSEINYFENYNIIKEKINSILPRKEDVKELKNDEIKYKNMEIQQVQDKFDYSNLYKKKVILVFGDTGSGKTSLSMKILENINEKKKVYIYKHPDREEIKKIGFGNIYSMSELGNMSDCACYIDEAQSVFPREDKKANEFLIKLYSLARQRKITLILSTSDSRWVNKSTESFVNSWFVKDTCIELAKNGSMLKIIVKNNSLFGLIDFKLNVNEFLYYDREDLHLGGKYTYTLPKFWSEKLSNAYA